MSIINGLDLVAGLDPSVPIEDFGPLSFLKNAVTIVLYAPITNGAVNEISALRLLQQLALHDPSNTNLSPIKAAAARLTLDAGQLDSTTAVVCLKVVAKPSRVKR